MVRHLDVAGRRVSGRPGGSRGGGSRGGARGPREPGPRRAISRPAPPADHRLVGGAHPVRELDAATSELLAPAYLPVAEVGNLVRALGQLGEAGVWSIGLDGDAEVALADHPLAGEACVLVVGAEGAGLSRLTRERCDALVRLPMRGHVGSLNASVAAAVALYELRRQRELR